ncbi:hypothetical protein K3495_g5105 [Podosphaera aphanis]|nr:hypothetical protein K3495_g5105 [Podosphaera aphanis]
MSSCRRLSSVASNGASPAIRQHNVMSEIFTDKQSRTKKIVQIATAVFYCFFAAGIVFGFAALKPVLVKEQFYRNLCTKDELERNVRTCVQQDIHLNFMFTLAAVGTNVAALPIGALLDRYGPKICCYICSVLLTCGAFFFAYGKELPFDGYLFGYLLIALGGSFSYMSSLHLSNAFPKYSGTILALFAGSFDSSSSIFLIYRVIYNWSQENFTPFKFFHVYLVVPAVVITAQLFMPKKSYKMAGEVQQDGSSGTVDNPIDERTALLRDDYDEEPFNSAKLENGLGAKNSNPSGIWGAMHGRSIKDQITSPWFILITLFTAAQMVRINYFVATVRSQYEFILGSYNEAVTINSLFDIALPLGGVVSIPFIGMVLDNRSTATVLIMLLTMTSAIGILGCLPYTWAAYSNVFLFVVFRPFFYTTIPDFAAKLFGFRNFGTVYGLISFLAGLCNLSANGLDALRHKAFHGDPIPVNILILGVSLVAGCSVCAYVKYKTYEIKRGMLELDANCTSETIMPGAESPERL